MKSAPLLTSRALEEGMIPDLGGISLRRLAEQAAAGEKDVTGVVARITDSQESRSTVPAMMFNSAI